MIDRQPDNYDCPKATSLFASPTRSDGSLRNARFFEGLHGGMDIAQPDGTPLLALADGEVIVKHEGGSIGGLGIWVRHAPEDTGTGKYVFVEYKHLAKLPDLAIGERVKMGQVIAATGNTGTTGKHYGGNGFYHLHMTARRKCGFRSRRPTGASSRSAPR
jgi:murein DD-endopeptidase MepM/ murein hydrolase activator NlpD